MTLSNKVKKQNTTCKSRFNCIFITSSSLSFLSIFFWLCFYLYKNRNRTINEFGAQEMYIIAEESFPDIEFMTWHVEDKVYCAFYFNIKALIVLWWSVNAFWGPMKYHSIKPNNVLLLKRCPSIWEILLLN